MEIKDKMFKSCLLIVNRECNLNCEFCESKKDIENASWDEMKKAIKIIDKFTNFTVIMGGEPLLYKYIYRLIDTMTTKNMDITLLTNGSLLNEETIYKLVDAGLKNITVSCDYTKGINVNKIIDLKQHFDDVSANILYDYNMVGVIYKIISRFTNAGVWSIIALYNHSTNYREHYLISGKSKDNMFKEYQEYVINCEINEIVKNFDNLLIHNSKDYIIGILYHLQSQNWHCKYPHRLVVNNDLKIMPCEDMKPFDNIDIFRMNEMLLLNNFSEFNYAFKNAINKCRGCYLPCYYDIETLTSLEIAHKGGKNVNYNKTGLSLCARSKNREIKESEDHICWFCGANIRIKSSYKVFCKQCGLMKCTSCGKCFCDGTKLEKDFLRWINETYCGDEHKLVLFSNILYKRKSFKVPDEFKNVDKKMIDNAYRCLVRCSKYMKGEL